MHAALLALCTETVSHAVATGTTAYGLPSYASPPPRPARVQAKVQRLTNAQGQEVVSTCKVFLDGAPPVALADKLTLPDGTTPPIQLLYAVRDEVGVLQHYEVWL